MGPSSGPAASRLPPGQKVPALLVIALALGVTSALPSNLLPAAFNASKHKCAHGHQGVLVLVHEDTTPAEYAASIEARMHPDHASENRFAHRDWTHVRAVAMHSIHPATLHEVVFQHEHTVHVEADCRVRDALPQPIPDGALAGVFGGRYYPAAAAQCQRNVTVHEPGKTTSYATVTATFSRVAGQPCNNVNDDFTSTVVVITMTGLHEGTMELRWAVRVNQTAPSSNSTNTTNATSRAVGAPGLQPLKVGTYAYDPMADMMDKIKWSDGTTWMKLPGSAYNKNSSIGPLNVDGKRHRNEEALIRWNWGLDRIDKRTTELTNTYEYGAATGKGTALYVLDTGTMISHDDFGGRAIPGYSAGCATGEEEDCKTSFAYQGVINDEVMARDKLHQMGCSTHGTHTASSAAGTKYGVAGAARVIPVQVLGCNGSGKNSLVVAGIDWATRHAAAQVPRLPAVMTLSLGGDTRSAVLIHAVKAAVKAGVTVVVAAGNNNSDACGESPASAPESITVGATGLSEPMYRDGKPNTDHAHIDMKAPFSNWGSCVDVHAPGMEILAAIPVYQSVHMTSILSGTSMAAPLVSGVALQLLGLHPDFSPQDVSRAIRCLAQPDVIHGLDQYTGNNLLQGGAQMTRSSMAGLIAAQQSLTVTERRDLKLDTRQATKCYMPAPSSATMERAQLSQADEAPFTRADEAHTRGARAGASSAQQRALQAETLY